MALPAESLDNHYVNPLLVSLYDLGNGWSEDREFYYRLADRPGMNVLDFGCGTGMLCHAYAQDGHCVVGVDPAAAMLKEASGKPGAHRVQWVHSDSQQFRSEQKFDLIIMTGHAFQVLLNRESTLALFSNVQRHLKPTGRFAFESRNPAHNWFDEWHGRSVVYDSPHGSVTESLTVTSASDEFVEFIMHYQVAGQLLASPSKLRFFSASAICDMITHTGLHVTAQYGNWDQKAWAHDDKEMIFIVQRELSSQE